MCEVRLEAEFKKISELSSNRFTNINYLELKITVGYGARFNGFHHPRLRQSLVLNLL